MEVLMSSENLARWIKVAMRKPIAGQLHTIGTTGSMVRHLGKLVHPQNFPPALGPDLAVRNAMGAPHFGHCNPAAELTGCSAVADGAGAGPVGVSGAGPPKNGWISATSSFGE